MSQSYSKFYSHIVFHTKNNDRLITETLLRRFKSDRVEKTKGETSSLLLLAGRVWRILRWLVTNRDCKELYYEPENSSFEDKFPG